MFGSPLTNVRNLWSYVVSDEFFTAHAWWSGFNLMNSSFSGEERTLEPDFATKHVRKQSYNSGCEMVDWIDWQNWLSRLWGDPTGQQPHLCSNTLKSKTNMGQQMHRYLKWPRHRKGFKQVKILIARLASDNLSNHHTLLHHNFIKIYCTEF